MTPQNSYTVLGMMSGTSLDGLDLACCRFTKLDDHWKFEVLASETVAYHPEWFTKLAQAWKLEGASLNELHQNYGSYLGVQAHEFLKKNQLKADLIASHGHTVFHRPEQGITLQIGHAGRIADITGVCTVNNFRQEDVAKGGQGAPLVPIGDRLLFPDYTVCLNIGGIANLSFDQLGQRVAFDVCPANQLLNYLAQKLNMPFDKNGEIAAKGAKIPQLLNQLNALEYYSLPYPKSLGREWVEAEVFPLVDQHGYQIVDVLHTCCLHIAKQIAQSANDAPKGTMLVTGGGAWNDFLMEHIRQFCTHMVEIPSAELINYKEAIIFALLGLLRLREEINCLASVTGASSDSSAGDIYYPQTDRLY